MTMTANDVIESYVTEIALQLPRKLRNDVAYELRALLNEGLQDKAEEEGRDADAAMAIEFVRAFGRPEEVAARYRPSMTIIDPADGQKFLRISIIGLVVIWCLGLLEGFQRPVHSFGDFLLVLGHWWGGVVIPSLWWPGMLITGFGISHWLGQRRPQSKEWKPSGSDPTWVNRTARVMAVIAMLFGLYVISNPSWVLDFFWNGHAAPAAYEALTYTDTFLHRQAPWLFFLIAFNILTFVIGLLRDRWSAFVQRFETVSIVAGSLLMLWTALDGPVMKSQMSDTTCRAILFLIAVITLAGIAIQLYRKVKPAPDLQART